jgi:hypothetical protein
MKLQEIATFILIASATVYTLYHIILLFIPKKKYKPGCPDCEGNCMLKEIENDNSNKLI